MELTVEDTRITGLEALSCYALYLRNVLLSFFNEITSLETRSFALVFSTAAQSAFN